MTIQVALGIDIGGTNTVYGLIDDKGNCIADGSVRTGDFETPELLVSKINHNVVFLLNEHNLTISGIGVGAPNGNFYKGTIEYAPNLIWNKVINLVDLFNQYYDVPVYVTNDANAAAIGEMTYGAAKGMQDFIMITLGTGLGSGFVSRGKLIYGHDSFAGELGHTIIDVNGRLCGCGRKGCLETYASATGMLRTAKNMLTESNRPSLLRKYSDKDLTSEQITKAALKGDELSLEIFDYTAEKLALGIVNAIAITSPESIILFGGLAQAGNVLIAPLKKYVDYFLLEIYKGKTNIIVSSLNNNKAAILGASALVWNEIKK